MKHVKIYSVWWNNLTAERKTYHFERIALSGIHFNEDQEENWQKCDYGACSWDRLTDKMKDQIVAWGL